MELIIMAVHRIFLLPLLLCLGSGTALGQVSQTEREALIDLYHATGGDEWHDNQGWLSSLGSECNWHGVQCASPGGDHFVLRLMLPANNLIGELPESLAGLEGLITLWLPDNALEGTIPPDLWGLSTLQDLSLRNSGLTGLVPPAILALPEGMPRTQVDLSGNRLEGFGLADFPEAPQGREIRLDVAGNLIDALPPSSWRESGAIEILDLSGNRIEATLAFDDMPWPGLQKLDLSGNTITGFSGLNADNLPDLQALNLNDNRIEALPESLTTLDTLTDLDASNNRLAGELPEWFAELNLARLGLDNNDLSGPVARVFAAMDLESFPLPGPHSDLGLILHVANNRFAGPLPEIDFGAFNTPAQGQSPEFGLDLCFNDIELPDSETLATIDNVHRGLALAPCLGREQIAMDPTISGSWYQPQRAGEGLTQMLLDNGQLLTYWFTYTPPDDDEPPEQMWLFGISEPGESWSEFRPLRITSGGRFDHGLMGGAPAPSRAWMRENRLDADNLHFFYDYRGQGFCITGACFWEVLTERFDLTRLTRLAGTACGENRSRFEHFAGAWYNPERVGEGFIVEILSGSRAVVYWFTYRPDDSGAQAWMMGDAEIFQVEQVGAPVPRPSRARVHFDHMVQPQGTQFGNDFNPAAVDKKHWGELTIHFDGDNHGRVEFDSVFEEYGSGEYPIERLARPMLAECE